MPDDGSKAVVRRWLTAWNEHDLDAAEALLDPGYVRHDANVPEVVGAGAQRQFVAGIFAAFPDIHVAEEQLVADGDLVAARVTISGTQDGAFMGLAATGRAVSFQGSEMYRVTGDRIA